MNSEFNYVRNESGECVLVPGMAAQPADDSSCNTEDYWYDRTAFRKVLYSTCEGGDRIDRGASHLCPGIKGHSAMFWMLVILFPFAMTALVAWWWYKKSGMARGQVVLPLYLCSSLITATQDHSFTWRRKRSAAV